MRSDKFIGTAPVCMVSIYGHKYNIFKHIEKNSSGQNSHGLLQQQEKTSDQFLC